MLYVASCCTVAEPVFKPSAWRSHLLYTPPSSFAQSIQESKVPSGALPMWPTILYIVSTIRTEYGVLLHAFPDGTARLMLSDYRGWIEHEIAFETIIRSEVIPWVPRSSSQLLHQSIRGSFCRSSSSCSTLPKTVDTLLYFRTTTVIRASEPLLSKLWFKI